jgi:hypothetical protein
MVTEIDLLKEEIPRLELKFGRGNPFVKMLKAQLDALQNRPGQQSKFGQDRQGHKNPSNIQIH